MSDSLLSGGLSNLGRQADKIIDSETEWNSLAPELDVELYREDDGYPEWHSSTPFEPMFLAYLYATVEERKLSGLPDHFEKNPKLARAFGFDPADLPSPSTFKPSRIEKRFEDLESTVNLAAKEIRQLAAERGSPIGNPLTASFVNGEMDSEPTKRTINRMLRQKGKKVLKEVERTVFPSMSLPRPDNAIYEDDELLTLETVATINNSAANQGSEQLADLKNPDPSLDDPFYEDGPSGETLLESVKDLSVDGISEKINFALRKTYSRAKPKLEELDNFDTNVMVALDITYVGYWADGDDIEWVQGAPKDKEYDRCFKFATAAIVGQHSHFTVAVLPLGSTEYADNDSYPGNIDQSYHIGDVTRHLLDLANDYVNIRMVVADREFYATDVIDAIEGEDLWYIIPAPKRRRLKRKCNNYDEIKRGYSDEPRNEALYVEHDYVIRGPVKHNRANTRKTTNLVILPPDEGDDTHGRDEPQPFVTNIQSLSDKTPVDRRSAIRRIERYSNRAAIENTYTSIKECAAKTTSKEIEVRWFHFGFACIIYNLWLLVDLLTQERIGVIETRKMPRIKLSRFLRWVDHELRILI